MGGFVGGLQPDGIVRGVPTAFAGDATDVNEQLGLPCSAYEWTTDRPDVDTSFPLYGCYVSASFSVSGTRVVTLRVTDDGGKPGFATRNMVVIDPPPTGPPLVTIVAPADMTSNLPLDQTYHLKATASDPDGEPMTYRWTFTVAGAPALVLGTTLELDWRPHDGFPDITCGEVKSGTLRFEATAPDGTGSDRRTIQVFYPPC